MKKNILYIVIILVLLVSCSRLSPVDDIQSSHGNNASEQETAISPSQFPSPDAGITIMPDPSDTLNNNNTPEPVDTVNPTLPEKYSDITGNVSENTAVGNKQAIEVIIGQKAYNLNDRLFASDIEGLGQEELACLRNSYYARHGYIFKNEKYTQIFSSYDWYQPTSPDVENMLTYTDKANINLIISAEGKGANQYKIPEEFILTDPAYWKGLRRIEGTETWRCNIEDLVFESKGKIDLNSDGIKDNIIFDCNYDDPDGVVRTLFVNGLSAEVVNDGNSSITFMDFDKNDRYIEIVTDVWDIDGFDSYIFFRYTGTELVRLGWIDNFSVGEYFLLDGSGKLVNNYNYIDNMDPLILTGYYELQGNKFVYQSLDPSYFFGDIYELTDDCEFFFSEGEEKVDQFKWERVRFKKGDKILFNDIGFSTSGWIGRITWVNITLSDGRTGILHPTYEWMP